MSKHSNRIATDGQFVRACLGCGMNHHRTARARVPVLSTGAAHGESLHRYATELDLAAPAAHAWLAASAARFGFVQRYSWEHF
jgi:hypothetical protein